MEFWIPITIFAAFMQNLRSALQKYLKGQLSTTGATFCRFGYAAPLTVLYLTCLVLFVGYKVPATTSDFYLYGSVGAIAQIMGTATLVSLFSMRNFAVGTTFSKTETIQAAIFGIVVLGETISIAATFAILLSLVGVIMISMTQSSLTMRELATNFLNKTALIGIASGAFFGVSAVSYRAAALSLDGGDFVIKGATTLVFVTIFQTIIMAVYMRIREPGQLTAVLSSWRISAWVGLTGMLGSVGWITAMTIEKAAYVRALGQIELVFTFAASYLFFRERSSAMEVAGIAIVTLGILALLLYR
ncbi:MAG: DMT family transporter [Pseudomonadota bacterium]